MRGAAVRASGAEPGANGVAGSQRGAWRAPAVGVLVLLLLGLGLAFTERAAVDEADAEGGARADAAAEHEAEEEAERAKHGDGGVGRIMPVTLGVGGTFDDVPALLAPHTPMPECVGRVTLPHLDRCFAVAKERGRGGGVADGPLFVLVHGASSLQDASYWKEHLPFLQKLGDAIALDFPGHGRAQHSGSHPTTSDAAALLVEVLRLLGPTLSTSVRRRGLVLIGRSWGGAVVTSALPLLEQKAMRALAAAILIAPATSASALTAVPRRFREELPVLLVWAEDDTTIPFANSDMVLSTFTRCDTLFFPAPTAGEGTRYPLAYTRTRNRASRR